MDCREVEPHLIPYLHTELDPGVMRAVQVHLAGCAACREALAARRHVHDVVAPLYLAALAHEECTPAERSALYRHLAYCEGCRREASDLARASSLLTKHLALYRLPEDFRAQVMHAWTPHRLGQRIRRGGRGLADLIERAEARGNSFSYERHIDRFKEYAYLAAYREVRDFLWAGAIARQIFIRGMPVFPAELTPAAFLRWLAERAREIAAEGGWEEAAPPEDAGGLTGFGRSRKLRRHHRVLRYVHDLSEPAQMPFLLHYVQRVEYERIGTLLGEPRLEVLRLLRETTAAARSLLDDETAPARADTLPAI